MRKSTRIVKRLLALFLVVLMSINTLGAVVSDNDGSAFITKAEFDSLKNDFQSQIDQYNTSIDSKIDGAIASYLSGIKLTKKETKSTLYSPTEGILSLGNNDFAWLEGRMDMKFYGGIYRYSGFPGFFTFELSTSNPSNFSETLISDVDYVNGTGRFVGYYKTKQYFVSNGNNAKNYAYRQKNLTDINGFNGGYFAISNQELTTAGQIYTIGFYDNTMPESYWSTNVLECMGTQASFRRELVDNDENWTGGLIMNNNTISHKFNNNDAYKDWCNDDTTDGHTAATTLNAVGISGNGVSHYTDLDTKATSVINANIITTNAVTTGAAIGTQIKPYLGFVSTITDWNKIYIGSFDNILSTVLPSSDANATNNIITNTKGNHLKLGAGMPVIECKAEEKITYEFEFKDKTKNYWVWVKEGSFDSTKQLSTEKSSCISKFDFTDSTSSYNSTNNCIKVVNGVGKATWTVENKSVIYLKWATEGNINEGGGILLPQKTCIVETQ